MEKGGARTQGTAMSRWSVSWSTAHSRVEIILLADPALQVDRPDSEG